MSWIQRPCAVWCCAAARSISTCSPNVVNARSEISPSCVSNSYILSRRRRLGQLLAGYANALEIVWCQEEPRNQGAWYQIQHHLRVLTRDDQTLGYAGRAPSASPACGNAELHRAQQRALVETALSAGRVDDPGERLEDTDEHDQGW